MPDEPLPEENGDLTARLRELEERIGTERPAAAVDATAEPTAEPRAEQPPAGSEAAAPPKPAAKRAPRKAVPTATPAKAPAKRAAKSSAKAPANSPAKAPAKAPANSPAKAPAKKTAAKKAVAAPAKRATRAAVPSLEDRAATPWPVPATPVAPPPGAPRPAAPPRPAAVPAPALPAEPVAPVAPVEEPPGVVAASDPAREPDGLVRLLVALAVLLLAAAAGLGAAAFVEHRDRTYRADTVVRLDPGPDPTLPIDDTVAAGVASYVSLAASHAFTLTAAQRAQLPGSAVQRDVQAQPDGTRQLRLEVFAGTSTQARTLAAGAGAALVEAVNLQEAVAQPSPGDRLAAAVVVEAEHVTKTAPKDRDAWVAGALAAGAVLVLAGLAVVLRATRRP